MTTRSFYGKNCGGALALPKQSGRLSRGTMLTGDKEILDLVSDSAVFVLIATLGGWVKFVMEGSWKFTRLVAILSGAAFSGFLAYMALWDMNISAAWMSAITGIAGSSGGTVLDHMQRMLVDYLAKKFGVRKTTDEQDIS